MKTSEASEMILPFFSHDYENKKSICKIEKKNLLECGKKYSEIVTQNLKRHILKDHPEFVQKNNIFKRTTLLPASEINIKMSKEYLEMACVKLAAENRVS